MEGRVGRKQWKHGWKGLILPEEEKGINREKTSHRDDIGLPVNSYVSGIEPRRGT